MFFDEAIEFVAGFDLADDGAGIGQCESGEESD
jgi:hypothetical protein